LINELDIDQIYKYKEELDDKDYNKEDDINSINKEVINSTTSEINYYNHYTIASRIKESNINILKDETNKKRPRTPPNTSNNTSNPNNNTILSPNPREAKRR